MAQTKKKTSRKAKIHTGSKKSSRTAKTSSKTTKSRVKKHAKRVGMTKKSTTYWKGTPKGQTLKIAYNGIGNEFAFTLANNNGKIGGTFHVSGNQLMNIMGLPLMVVPT